MKKKNIYMLYIKDKGYYVRNNTYNFDIKKAKRYKTLNGILKIYNKHLEIYNNIIIEYEIHKSKKVGKVIYNNIEYKGQYDLNEYYNKLKEKKEINGHKITFVESVNTYEQTEDNFWET